MQVNRLAHSQVSPSLKAQRQGLTVENPAEFVGNIEVGILETLRYYRKFYTLELRLLTK